MAMDFSEAAAAAMSVTSVHVDPFSSALTVPAGSRQKIMAKTRTADRTFLKTCFMFFLPFSYSRFARSPQKLNL